MTIRRHPLRAPLLAPPRNPGRRAVLAAAGAAAALTACGGRSGSGSGLSFFSWSDQKTMQPLMDAFEAANPDARITFSSAPPVTEYVTTLQSRLLAGTGADVFVMAGENKTNLIEAGLVRDLTSEPLLAVVAQGNKDLYSADGKVYAASVSAWAGGFLYNKALTDAVGMTRPPQSWDEFLQVCHALGESGVQAFYEPGDGIPTSLAALIGMHHRAEGGTPDADVFAGRSTFVDQWEEPLTQYSRLFTEGVVGANAATLTADQVTAEFVNGRAAFMGSGSWSVATVREQAPDLDLALMPVPGPTAGDTMWSGAPAPGYSINAKSEHLDEARAFVQFLTSAEGTRILNRTNGDITTTSDFTPEVDPVLAEALTGLQEGDYYLPQTAWPQYQDALNTEAVARLQQLAQGKVQPAEVAAALDAKLRDAQA